MLMTDEQLEAVHDMMVSPDTSICLLGCEYYLEASPTEKHIIYDKVGTSHGFADCLDSPQRVSLEEWTQDIRDFIKRKMCHE